MSLLKKLFTQCAHPKGRMGRAMLKFMNFCHAPLTNWGLNLVDIQDGWTMLDIGCGGGATLKNGCRQKKRDGHTVYISEYNMPGDFSCIWQKQITNSVNLTKTYQATERLWTL